MEVGYHDAEEKNQLVSISTWKFCHTPLAKLMAIVVDPCSAEFDAKEKNKLESISHESFA